MGDDTEEGEGSYAADEADEGHPEKEETPKKKFWRDSRMEQIHSPTEALKREKMFPSVEDVFKKTMEKSRLGLGERASLLKSQQSTGLLEGGRVPRLTESLQTKKIHEKTTLYSGRKKLGGKRRPRLRPRIK